MFHPCCLTQLSDISRQNVLHLLKVCYKNLHRKPFNLIDLAHAHCGGKQLEDVGGDGFMFSNAWYQLQFSHASNWLSLLFSRIWNQLRVLARLAPVTVFARLAPVTAFPRLAPIACFPTLSTSSVCFPALGTSYMFSRP